MQNLSQISPTKDDKFLTTTQAAKFFKVSRFSVLLWIKQGKLSAISTPGGHHRISKKAVRNLVKQHPIENKPIKGVHQKSEGKLASIVSRLEKVDFYDTLNKSVYASGKYFSELKKKLSKVKLNKLSSFF